MSTNAIKKNDDPIYGSMRLPVKNTKGQFCFGFVGYADIIGFENKIIDPRQREIVADAYQEILRRVKDRDDWIYTHKGGMLKGYGKPAGQEYYHVVPTADHLYMVSDSLFFILIPESSIKYEIGPSLLDFFQFGVTAVKLMSEIMTTCWEFGLPARGAISDGNIYYNADKQIFIGEALAKAVRWENTQSFAWFTVDPSSKLSQEAQKYPKSLLSHVTKPLKNRDVFFKEKEVMAFQKKWPFGELIPLTACPELADLSEGTEDGIANAVANSIKNQIEHNMKTKNPKHMKLWQNTREVLRFLEMT